LIPIWVATLAVKQNTRAIHFESAAQILEFFRLPKDGPHYRRMVEGFQRVFAATIFFGTEQRPEKTPVMDLARFHFFDRMHLWFNAHDEGHLPSRENFGNQIILSEAFYREIFCGVPGYVAQRFLSRRPSSRCVGSTPHNI
jgi:hypothetical protein